MNIINRASNIRAINPKQEIMCPELESSTVFLLAEANKGN